MIKISFSSAVSIYLCFSILLVFVLWIFYNLNRNDIHSETKHLQQCPYCTYIFFDYKSNAVSSKMKETIEGEQGEGAGPSSMTTEPNEPPQEHDRLLTCPRCHSYIRPEDNSSIEQDEIHAQRLKK